MKATHLFCLCAAALLCEDASAQFDSLSTPHIAVNGTARKEVAPDVLHWSLQVKNIGLDLPKVAEQHSKKVSALLDLLKANGIADKDVQTAQMQLSENMVYRHNENVKEGFLAETELSFKLEQLGKYKTIWFALAGLADVSVKGVRLDSSKRIELNKEVRKTALKAAKEKAVAMADELGSRVGEPLVIEDDVSFSEGLGRGDNAFNGNAMLQNSVSAGGADREDMLAPGSIPIAIRVRVTFRLLNPGN